MHTWGFSQVRHYVGIYKLYSIRNDKTNIKEYFDKIPNTITKKFTLCHHPHIFKESKSINVINKDLFLKNFLYLCTG